MARARNIKPALFVNDLLADCEPLARLLFIGLWTVADSRGVMEDRPRKIKAEVLPHDDRDARNLIEQLIEAGFVRRFEAEGREYLHVINFQKHQNPHKNEDPKFPDPEEYQSARILLGLIPSY